MDREAVSNRIFLMMEGMTVNGARRKRTVAMAGKRSVVLGIGFAMAVLPIASGGFLWTASSSRAQEPTQDSAPLPVARPVPKSNEANPIQETGDQTDVPGTDDATPLEHVRLAETDKVFGACTRALTALGTAFEPVDPVTSETNRECGIARPIRVTEVLPGIALGADTRMRCATALALAEWVKEFVLPAGRAFKEQVSLSGLLYGSTYICRTRNNVPGGRLSEHGFGNAVDVSGFRFDDGTRVMIKPRDGDGSLEAAFQRSVRASACLKFTTVLGPGSDGSHTDHIHLDIKARRGGYRLCQ
ncbi:MAG: extensin family protein [Pseudomonadota bacterium]